MNMINKVRFSLLVLMPLIFAQAIADSPVSITQPDRHSVEVKGNIGLYRVQVENMNLGKGADHADAEVYVTLDSNPNRVYTLQLRADSPPANKIMADTLRDAYFNKRPVTLYHQINIKRRNNLKILMVQLN